MDKFIKRQEQISNRIQELAELLDDNEQEKVLTEIFSLNNYMSQNFKYAELCKDNQSDYSDFLLSSTGINSLSEKLLEDTIKKVSVRLAETEINKAKQNFYKTKKG